MRALALLLLASALVLSGCLSEDDSGTGDATKNGGNNLDNVTVPQAIVISGELKGVGACGLAGCPVAPPDCPLESQQCVDHVVTVPAGTWNVTFTLVGTNGMVTGQGVPSGTDYDLFVSGVGDSTNASGEDDVVTARLPAGDYTARVLAWHDIDGSYTLTVTFAAA
ncbi:MAG: hypothetical protein AABY18_03645 [Candidatus Thermoplasmatota archaeon]